MRCAISSRAGQVLARGRLYVQSDESGALRLNFVSDRGTFIPGGIVAPDGDMSVATQELFEQLFAEWRMTDLTLTAMAKM
ncbi:MAG: hypothetical protein SAJ12_20165 [Jaaginema sp. PMC 1079.18]|nr:hypothetical protein [Jaaginema sp. PMC 1080.18]MEC4853303.1 hypothetical protein [Jaaginema sp. PMC 1079.18]MEC4865482.1 hypothetical protein [Jaaginema sp. PMC 1078.18]